MSHLDAPEGSGTLQEAVGRLEAPHPGYREPQHESRRAVKAAGVLAASSLSATVIGLGSTKVVAAIYGPRGTGTLGLLAGAYSLVSLILGLGVDQGGTKAIAETVGVDSERHRVVVRTTIVLTSLLGVLGAVVTVVAAPLIARVLTGKASLAPDVQILAIVVGLSIASGGPAAYLHGTRQILRFAVTVPLASLVGTVLTITALLLGLNLVWSVIVIAQVVATGTMIIIGREAFTVSSTRGTRITLRESRRIVTLGVVFVTGSLATVVSGLGMRVLITRRLGIADTGFFQAGFAATSLASAFLLQALTVDYYPRLAQTRGEDSRTNAVMNHQLEFSLSMIAPLALAAVLFAPIGIRVLYGSAYLPSVHLAQIFALGEFMRVIAWGVGFVLAVRDAKKAFLFTQLVSASLPLILSLILLPTLGLAACALADVGTQAVLLAIVLVAARRYTGFRVSPRAVRRMCLMWLACLGAVLAGDWSQGWILQACLLCAVAGACVHQLATELDTSPRQLLRKGLSRVSSKR